ncbi:MAG TPA: 16S rRNA (guanine(527)-N(7))-methyltransferase RsmG [Alphaproteobacteria bacterium]|nr:16S rRNA (guanine(527)-N(7))-methyltransferase RsmG [Alphaproteobacteria bacterium]
MFRTVVFASPFGSVAIQKLNLTPLIYDKWYNLKIEEKMEPSLMNVSRETMERLKIYQRLLEEWQQKVNLISSSTLPCLWDRHFKDSLQLLSYLPQEEASLIDLGSGAGFPGLVLAVARPTSLNVTLVESDLKKCLFLENVSRETFSPVTILRERIESLPREVKGDVITARGLSPLPRLLGYVAPLMKENTICLFLKGKDVETEIIEAKKKWRFDLEIFPSLTDSTGSIVKVKHLARIQPHV